MCVFYGMRQSAFDTGAERFDANVPDSRLRSFFFQGRAIRFLGVTPEEPGAGPYLRASTTSDSLDDDFTVPHVLQETLLMLDYYEGGQSTRDRVFYALIGSAIQGAERNVEMVLSLQQFDFNETGAPPHSRFLAVTPTPPFWSVLHACS